MSITAYDGPRKSTRYTVAQGQRYLRDKLSQRSAGWSGGGGARGGLPSQVARFTLGYVSIHVFPCIASCIMTHNVSCEQIHARYMRDTCIKRDTCHDTSRYTHRDRLSSEYTAIHSQYMYCMQYSYDTCTIHARYNSRRIVYVGYVEIHVFTDVFLHEGGMAHTFQTTFILLCLLHTPPASLILSSSLLVKAKCKPPGFPPMSSAKRAASRTYLTYVS